ncbi:MAG: hypothetical protein ABIL68_11580 [bacterium]
MKKLIFFIPLIILLFISCKKESRHRMANEQLQLREAMLFLEDLAGEVLNASRVRQGESVAGRGPNTTGGTLIRPGGRNCYPAFWIRDFTMSLECGLIPPEEIEHALLLTAHCQAQEDWLTPTGSLVPRGAIADHITLDSKPIYFPGTYEFEAQGQPWGYYPSLDDHFYFVEIAWHLAVAYGRKSIFQEVIDGMSLLDRLALAFTVPTVKDGSELVWCEEKKRGVSFGFTDSIVHTGYLLFCSILRYRAAGQLADLYQICGLQQKAEQYRSLASKISRDIQTTFIHESGLLRASTGKSAQPDVWGSAFAVYSGALGERNAMQVSRALSRALSDGTIAWKGNIRHVPTDYEFSELSAWEQTVNSAFSKNRYQNGAYWNTPTGWVCYAVAQVDAEASRELALQYVEELRAGDFRQGDEYGSPYECIHPDGDYRQNAVYLTSVACPLAAFQRLGWINDSK